MSKQNKSTLSGLKSVDNHYSSPISGIKMPQIYSICEKFSVVLTSCSRLATLWEGE
jgi:hypothetical protein